VAVINNLRGCNPVVVTLYDIRLGCVASSKQNPNTLKG